ncbi:uncharacterized protein LOC111716397 isoform X5 [Eurytemora carolleeae]|uniref:uncharacterized protein LOC111716397 isoform X5 n=1 Tax=Eurytemora carolleeae TaxID=1294199 RepID=UPI000C79380B|nr:uncharacterized protein LOC111716397 isoform X5 [Eurytemora carolleeae]|eukprot:XP_023347610.1 uncharacterized protein LOC111716397 isoform X5 [Eurytemora affinis]
MTIQESGQELMAQPLKQIRPILISSCGPQLSRSLNIDVWTIKLSCGGPCLQTTVSLLLLQGQADVLMVQSTEETYISTLCISCSHWAGRLQTNQTSSWSTYMGGMRSNLYLVLVGYTDYISINVKISSKNIIRATPELYRENIF